MKRLFIGTLKNVQFYLNKIPLKYLSILHHAIDPIILILHHEFFYVFQITQFLINFEIYPIFINKYKILK